MNKAESAVSQEILNNPALLFLYYRIIQILGIKASTEAIISLNEYLEKICASSFIEKPAEFEAMLASREKIYEIAEILTVNETYFFRESVHFDLLLNLLPMWAKDKKKIHICCAAVSTGCEAYSIAMLLEYHNQKNNPVDYEIDAFDISLHAIETAKTGRFTENNLRADGSGWKYILDLYLEKDGNEYIINNNIRNKINFFTHNIMRGLEKRYDIIFFRNALIYFTSKNRLFVLNNIAECLFPNGLFFPGISEISSINHPLLAGKNSNDAFYFQKISGSIHNNGIVVNKMPAKEHEKPQTLELPVINTVKPPEHPKQKVILHVKNEDVISILGEDEGKSNSEKILNILNSGQHATRNAEQHRHNFSGSELAACAAYKLSAQDYENADTVITELEKYNSSALTKFLRGEYFFIMGKEEDARRYFEETIGKDKTFWPAFYRIAILSSQGNRDSYNYKLKKARESLELGKNSKYECFMGGFSPDYFIRILEKKLYNI